MADNNFGASLPKHLQNQPTAEKALEVAAAIEHGEKVIMIDDRLFTRAMYHKLNTDLGGEHTEEQLDQDFDGLPGYDVHGADTSAGAYVSPPGTIETGKVRVGMTEDGRAAAAENLGLTTVRDPNIYPRQQIPSINRLVQYCLTEADVARISRDRERDGAMGNLAKAGDILPAVIVRTFGDTPTAAFNIQVFTDGNFSIWKTSVTIESPNGDAAGLSHGRCQWPPRV